MNRSSTARPGLGARLLESVRVADPKLLLIGGYALYILIGWAILALPFSLVDGVGGAVDTLFTACSAVSTTGLVTLSTGRDFTFFGQGVILILIQLGGLGYMTLGSFAVLAGSGRLQPWREQVGRAVLNMPDGFHFGAFLRLIVVYSFVVELVGAALLYWRFQVLGVEAPVWSAVFHSISAFCTAGFSLYDNSFESFRDDFWINLTLIGLSYLGAIGFIVVQDLWHSLRSRCFSITLTTKIILAGTAVISIVGTAAMMVEEPMTGPISSADGWLAAWFQIMTASTTVGFNTLPIGELSNASVFLITLCMIMGASPAGTGGGIKTTSVTALWAVMMSVLRQRSVPSFFGREIPVVRLRLAVATVGFYLVLLCVGIYLLSLAEPVRLFDLVFESASALGTVGLSMGITADLSDAGKLILTGLMFFGRIGPLLFITAMFCRKGPSAPSANVGETPDKDVVI